MSCNQWNCPYQISLYCANEATKWACWLAGASTYLDASAGQERCSFRCLSKFRELFILRCSICSSWLFISRARYQEFVSHCGHSTHWWVMCSWCTNWRCPYKSKMLLNMVQRRHNVVHFIIIITTHKHMNSCDQYDRSFALLKHICEWGWQNWTNRTNNPFNLC